MVFPGQDPVLHHSLILGDGPEPPREFDFGWHGRSILPGFPSARQDVSRPIRLRVGGLPLRLRALVPGLPALLRVGPACPAPSRPVSGPPAVSLRGVRIPPGGNAMPISTITRKGQVTIPTRIRDVLRMKPGDQIVFMVAY